MRLSTRLAGQLMRAVRVSRFGGSEVLTVESNVPVPKPGDNQVLLRVQAAGVNPVDTYIRTGTYGIKPSLPYTPGWDAAGVVEETGPGVSDFKKGDRIFTIKTESGSYAEYAVADQRFVGSLGGDLTIEQGAGVGMPSYTAYRATMVKGRAEAGQTVLIHGASGAVGLAGVQIAKAKGLKVLGTAGSQEGMDLVTSNGATAFNHREEGYTDQIMAATEGKGPDLIVEMLSNVNLQKDLEMIGKEGTIVIVGTRGTIEINPRLTMVKECVVTGISLAVAPPEVFVSMHAGIQEGIQAGWLRPHICKEYTLDQAPAAHDDVINTMATQGKRIIKI